MTTSMKTFELQLDGLVGPTHNYAGLVLGNLASTKNQLSVSNPKAAALQGLEKMRRVMEMGIPQAVMPPQQRPRLDILRNLGYTGSVPAILQKVAKENPTLLAACSSASSMWMANAAAISASADTQDGKVHFTPANLISQFHRALESEFTAKVLAKIFFNEKYFHHHAPLPAQKNYADEGAANHCRLGKLGKPSLSLFVYGRSVKNLGPKKYPARQTLEASQSIARQHGLLWENTFYLQQNPAAIDAGVFHNDVISVTDGNLFLLHEKAFVNQNVLLKNIKQRLMALNSTLDETSINFKKISAKQISIKEAVSTYLFNSQLLTLNNGNQCLLAALECAENKKVKQYLENWAAEAETKLHLEFMDLRQSMRNGGGPACLRLRVPLTEIELKSMHAGTLLTENLYAKLKTWIHKHYRESLQSKDLADPALFHEGQLALDELSQLLGLANIYTFQQ